MECPECKNDVMVDDVDECIICKAPLHISDNCSVACEGDHVKKRKCKNCATTNEEKTMALRKIESWRGLAKKHEKKKKNFLYLQRQSKDFFSGTPVNNEQHVLKNANSLQLKPLTINKKEYSLSNTCSFDSIF